MASTLAASPLLPTEKPLTIIESRTRVFPKLNTGEIWSYRELLFFLVWRDLKVRYKQTLLGVAWAIIQPLTTILLFTVTFSKWAKIPSEGFPYPLFSFLGILAWNFFAAGARNSVNSLTSSAALISKVYFPRILCPCASVVATLADFLVALTLMIPMLIYYKISLSFSGAATFVAVIFFVGLFSLGFGLWLGPINARFRDIAQVLPFAFQIWMYATPVIYPMEIIPEKYRHYIYLNPMVGFIEAVRSAILGKPLNTDALGWAVAVTVVALITGIYFFQKREADIADFL